jgi:hypothetical protein
MQPFSEKNKINILRMDRGGRPQLWERPAQAKPATRRSFLKISSEGLRLLSAAGALAEPLPTRSKKEEH